jgi:hypothetical protein
MFGRLSIAAFYAPGFVPAMVVVTTDSGVTTKTGTTTV